MNTTESVFDAAWGPNIPPTPNGYKVLCIFNLILSLIAAILSAILLFAMTMPLIYPKRRKYYSTYNLYLAFVAFPELVAHGLHVYLVLAHEQWNLQLFSNTNGDDINETTTIIQTNDLMWMFDFRYDHLFYIFSTTCNLYTNAFLTYELYMLLKNSNARKKQRSPTIARVTKQAMISYGLGLLIVVVHYIVARRLQEGSRMWYILYLCFSLIYVVVVPLSVMVWICYQIIRQELLVSTKSMYEGRLKILVVYFARIVLSDLLLWIPAAGSYFVSFFLEHESPTKIITYNITLLFTAIQVIVTFGCSMTKPDARKLVTDMICNWVYCRKGSCEDWEDCDDCEFSRRWSIKRLSRGNDPYLFRFSPGRAPMESGVHPTLETVAVEESQFSSHQDNTNLSDPEKSNESTDPNRDPEA